MTRFLYVFFFGYASMKWRRLIRTILVLPLIFPIVFTLDELVRYNRHLKFDDLYFENQFGYRIV